MKCGSGYSGHSILSTGKLICPPLLSTRLIVLYRFGASTCGVPLLLRESDISTEYPTDVDDENISEAGIQTGGTGETKMSNTLALIGVTRILTKVLEDIHPQALKYDLPLKKIRTLTDELDQWNESLPQHLRLKFINDKPSTGIISDRSPLLVRGFTFCFIHVLTVCSLWPSSTPVCSLADLSCALPPGTVLLLRSLLQPMLLSTWLKSVICLMREA